MKTQDMNHEKLLDFAIAEMNELHGDFELCNSDLPVSSVVRFVNAIAKLMYERNQLYLQPTKNDAGRVSKALINYLEKQDDKNATMFCGNVNYTANQLIDEINNQTELGNRIVDSVVSLTISLLFRGKEQI